MGEFMNLDVGMLVSRVSYSNDVIFKIVSIDKDVYYLKGINVRLRADSNKADLVIVDDDESNLYDDIDYIKQIKEEIELDRDEYFYLPGKVLHFDGDKSYLDRCLNFYKEANVVAYGIHIDESLLPSKINNYLEELNPDIIVITGHDSYYAKRVARGDDELYQNTKNFIRSVKLARKYEKDPEKLVIIAGACQSNYEELIRAGANFASSPKRINIHALDPAIIAIAVAFSNRNEHIDLIGILSKTKYGSDGLGGIMTSGMMYTGYPRK